MAIADPITTASTTVNPRIPNLQGELCQDLMKQVKGQRPELADFGRHLPFFLGFCPRGGSWNAQEDAHNVQETNDFRNPRN
jgi:hypothetical protein